MSVVEERVNPAPGVKDTEVELVVVARLILVVEGLEVPGVAVTPPLYSGRDILLEVVEERGVRWRGKVNDNC